MSVTINKTTQVTPTLSDLMAVWDSVNSTTRNTSLSSLLTLIQANLTSSKAAVQYEAPNATGFSLIVNSTDGTDRHLLIVPAAGYDAGTIVLPSTGLVDKQTVLVTCTQAVTTLTITSAKTLYGEPAALSADDFFTLKYDITFDSWYRVG